MNRDEVTRAPLFRQHRRPAALGCACHERTSKSNVSSWHGSVKATHGPTACWPSSRASVATSPRPAVRPPATRRSSCRAAAPGSRGRRSPRPTPTGSTGGCESSTCSCGCGTCWSAGEPPSSSLSTWVEPEPFAGWLEEQAAELQSLRSACSGHLERRAQLADLCNQRAGIEQSVQAALGSLGPEWDRDRIRASDGWIGLERRGAALSGTAQLNERRAGAPAGALADEADAAPELRRATGPDGAATSALDVRTSTADPEAAGETVERAAQEPRRATPARRGSHEPASAPVQTWALSARGPSPRSRVPVLSIVGLGVVAALVARPSDGAAALRARLVAGGCALLAVAVATRRRLSRTVPARNAELGAALAPCRRRGWPSLPTSLGLTDSPSDSDVETARREDRGRSSLERSAGGGPPPHAGGPGTTQGRARIAGRSQPMSSRPSVRDSRNGRPPTGSARSLSPDGVLESLSALQAAWKDLGALERVDAKIGQRRTRSQASKLASAALSGGFRELGGPADSLEADPAGTARQTCAARSRNVLELRGDEERRLRCGR